MCCEVSPSPSALVMSRTCRGGGANTYLAPGNFKAPEPAVHYAVSQSVAFVTEQMSRRFDIYIYIYTSMCVCVCMYAFCNSFLSVRLVFLLAVKLVGRWCSSVVGAGGKTFIICTLG